MNSKTTVNVERRTWDKEAYEARARSRAAATAESEETSAIRSNLLDADDEPEEFLPAQQGRAGPLGSARAFLKSRSRKVDLEGKLGSTELIDPTAASTIHSKLTTTPTTTVVENPSISSGVTKCKDGVGWHCRVCDCFLKDSLTYLDHINGRKHQRYLGYTMRVEQSTTAEVGNVLKSLAESEKMKQQHHFSGGGLSTENGGVDYEMVIRNKDEETQRRKADRARRREERKRKEKQEKDGNNSRSVVEVIETRMSVVETMQTAEELEEGREDKSGKFDNEYGEEEDDDDPADYNDEYDCGINPMAAMMGFTGFGGSKK
jgi:U4/U6.U5 tri-snRNP component SNU23